jgi:hypothetical protein
MKKIYTLLLLFTITLFYSIPTQAFTFNIVNYEIIPGLTLTDLFETNQLIQNNDFTDDTNNDGLADNWIVVNSPVVTNINGIQSVENTIGTANRRVEQPLTSILNNRYYFNFSARKVSGANGLYSVYIGPGAGFATGAISSDRFLRFEGVLTSTNIASNGYQFGVNAAIGKIEVDYAIFIDLSIVFGLGSEPTLSQMQQYYEDYFEYKIYQEGSVNSLGYAFGYEVGYGEGYQEGVQEDNAYALGFAKGLLEGQDMETGSSLLILIVALIGFVMMIFGFTTKRGIFNLLSVGAFVVLGTLLVQFVGFVIIAIGLVLINIYYAFFGDL